MKYEVFGHEIKHASWTGIKEFKRSPKHFLEYLEVKRRRKLGLEKPTDAMLLGSVFHCLSLEHRLPEGEKFNDKYVVAPSFNKRTNAGKEDFAKFEQDNKGKEVITGAMFQAATNMSEAVRFSAKKYIEGLEAAEFKLEWEHESGIEILSFLDGVGGDYFLELKSCQNASPVVFQRQAWWDGYVHQVALYGEGMNRIKIVLPAVIVACESSPPYGVSINRISEEQIEEVYREVNFYINEFAEWLQDPTKADYQHWVPLLGYHEWNYLPKR